MRRFNAAPRRAALATPVPAFVTSVAAFSSPDPVKLRRVKKYCFNATNGNPFRGRDALSYDYERRIRLVGAAARQDIVWPLVVRGAFNPPAAFDPSCMVVADVISHGELAEQRLALPHPLPLYGLAAAAAGGAGQGAGGGSGVRDGDAATSSYDSVIALAPSAMRRLQGDADTRVLRIPVELRGGSSAESVVAHVIQVVEPDIRPYHMMRMEAQVELVTAFRNILMEFFEICCPPDATGGAGAAIRQTPRFHTLRIPALSLSLHDGKFALDIEKMHQQALIQAFHRCSLDVKDWFAVHPQLRVELHVPQPLLAGFERAFADEAWETPRSAVLPPKPHMYHGLPMPPQLIANAPGFIGGRKEIEALALPFAERVRFVEECEAAEAAAQEQLAESGAADGSGVAITIRSARSSRSSSARDDDNDNDMAPKITSNRSGSMF